jgi:hypothetical protein
MSDRRTFTADRALAAEYQRLSAELRSVQRRAAWPTPVQLDAAATPQASTPAPTYHASPDSYDAYGISIEVAGLALAPGRWYLVASSSQRFGRTYPTDGGAVIAYGYQYLLVDGSVVRSAKTYTEVGNDAGVTSVPGQTSLRSAWTIDTTTGADVRLRVSAVWTWFIGAGEPAPSQSLRHAQIIAYPG